MHFGAEKINSQPVALDTLESFPRTVYHGRDDKTMFIAGAGTLPDGEIVRVIDVAKGAGVEKVGIITRTGPLRSVTKKAGP